MRPIEASSKSYEELPNNAGQWPITRLAPTSRTSHVQLICNNDERLIKHVQFDSSTLVRSNTVCSGLIAPSSNLPYQPTNKYVNNNLLTSTGGVHFSQSSSLGTGNNLPHERLIQGINARPIASILTTSAASASAKSNQNLGGLELAAISSQYRQSISGFYNQVNRSHSSNFNSLVRNFDSRRGALLRTQATQTDPALSRSIPCLPAYLTLSPRAPESRRSTSMRGRRAPRGESHSETASLYQDSESRERLELENEVFCGVSTKETKSVEYPRDAEEFSATSDHTEEHRRRKSESRGQCNYLISPTEIRDYSTIIAKMKHYSRPPQENFPRQTTSSNQEQIAFKSLSFHEIAGKKKKSPCHGDESDEFDEKRDIFSDTRRHSVAADFLTDFNLLLYPPPGFEDSNEAHGSEKLKAEPPESPVPIASTSKVSAALSVSPPHSRKGSSGSSSNTDKAVCPENVDEERSLSDLEDFDSRVQSEASPTLVSDISSNLLSQSEDLDHNSAAPEAKGSVSTGANSVESSVGKLRSLFEPSTSKMAAASVPTEPERMIHPSFPKKLAQSDIISQASESSSHISVEPVSSPKSGVTNSSETTLSSDLIDEVNNPELKDSTARDGRDDQAQDFANNTGSAEPVTESNSRMRSSSVDKDGADLDSPRNSREMRVSR